MRRRAEETSNVQIEKNSIFIFGFCKRFHVTAEIKLMVVAELESADGKTTEKQRVEPTRNEFLETIEMRMRMSKEIEQIK